VNSIATCSICVVVSPGCAADAALLPHGDSLGAFDARGDAALLPRGDSLGTFDARGDTALLPRGSRPLRDAGGCRASGEAIGTLLLVEGEAAELAGTVDQPAPRGLGPVGD